MKPDLIQTWLTQMDVLGGLAAVLTRTPFILMEQCSAGNYSGTWKDTLRCWIGRRAVLIVANSETGKGYWLRENGPDRVKVIRNAVPVDEINSASHTCSWEHEIEDAAEVILFAGRYDAQKNVITLLTAIHFALQERSGAIAVLFGAGPLRDRLIAIVQSYGMEDRIKILPYTTEIWSWMKRANLFVSASLFEGSPNAIYEAAALRCPLVLSDIPEHRELLSDEGAFFVSPLSASDIASGIVTALSDRQEARRKSECAYVRLSGFTVDMITDEYLSVYTHILKHVRHIDPITQTNEPGKTDSGSVVV